MDGEKRQGIAEDGRGLSETTGNGEGPRGTASNCSYMISWSSQIWFLSPLKFFFYVFVFLLKSGTSPDFFILALLFLLFLYVFSLNAFVLCYGGLVEVEPSHLTI